MTDTIESWRSRGVILVIRRGDDGLAPLDRCLDALERFHGWPPPNGIILDNRHLVTPAAFKWTGCADRLRAFGLRWGCAMAFVVRADGQLGSTLQLSVLLGDVVRNRVCLGLPEAAAWLEGLRPRELQALEE